MENKISQAAIAYYTTQKVQWAEIQALNAINQLLEAQEKIKNLETEIQKLKEKKNGSTT